MESFTKVKLDDRQLGVVTVRAFGADAAVIASRELTGGFFNTAYDLELNDGRSVILKVAPSPETEILSYEKDILRAEVEALRLVHAAGGIPVPEVYFYDGSLQLIPCPYFFMEKIAGLPYSEVKESLSAEQQYSIEYELGAYQRLINEIKGPYFGLLADDSAAAGKSWRDTFLAMLQNVLQDAVRLGAELPAPLQEIELALEPYLPALDKVTQPRLIHWDLWNGNLFVQDGAVVSIIDWERAMWGDVLMENYFRHFENSQAFYKGYGSDFKSPDELQRIKLYDLYLDLIMVIECYPRQYKDENYVRWTRDNLAETWKLF